MSLFTGVACFSASVPTSVQQSWVTYGGRVLQQENGQKNAKARFYFCDGMEDPALSESPSSYFTRRGSLMPSPPASKFPWLDMSLMGDTASTITPRKNISLRRLLPSLLTKQRSCQPTLPHAHVRNARILHPPRETMLPPQTLKNSLLFFPILMFPRSANCLLMRTSRNLTTGLRRKFASSNSSPKIQLGRRKITLTRKSINLQRSRTSICASSPSRRRPFSSTRRFRTPHRKHNKTRTFPKGRNFGRLSSTQPPLLPLSPSLRPSRPFARRRSLPRPYDSSQVCSTWERNSAATMRSNDRVLNAKFSPNMLS